MAMKRVCVKEENHESLKSENTKEEAWQYFWVF